jgi:hypothetical protein
LLTARAKSGPSLSKAARFGTILFPRGGNFRNPGVPSQKISLAGFLIPKEKGTGRYPNLLKRNKSTKSTTPLKLLRFCQWHLPFFRDTICLSKGTAFSHNHYRRFPHANEED